MIRLFQLLRLGLGLEQIQNKTLSSFCELSETGWTTIQSMAEKQGVSAIALDGVNELVNYGDDYFHKGVSTTWWRTFLLQWMGSLLIIEQENRHQLAVMNYLADKISEEGIKMMVMKGQVNGLMYPNPIHRNPGDIDCYLFENYALGNDLARLMGAEIDEGWYKHSVIRYRNETIENHQFFVHTREGERSKRLQQELEEALKVKEWKVFPNSKVLIPPVQWNAMFLTYHACAHFLTEGLRLKQVLDWAMFLNKEQENVDWEQFYAFCDRHHLHRFAEAITAICVNYLGVKILTSAISLDSPYSDRILKSALYDDDYIYSSGEGRWTGRVHLIKSMFKYRWKYEDIYQQSIWKQLWWYISGFIFHTER